MTVDDLFTSRRPELQNAFADAFVTASSLSFLVRVHLARNIEQMVDANEKLDEKIASILFGQPEEAGYREKLLRGACLTRPNAAALRKLADEVGIALPAFGATEDGNLPEPDEDEVDDPIAAFRLLRTHASGRAKQVGNLKWLHDQVDQLRRLVYLPLRLLAKRFPDADSLVEMARHLSLLGSLCTKVEERVVDGSFSIDDFPWITEELFDAREAAQQALSAASAEQLNEALEFLKPIVEIELAKINGRLSNATELLDLPSVVERLQRLRNDLVPYFGAQERYRFDSDLKALAGTADRLPALVTEHTKWQRIDDLLSNLDNMLTNPVSLQSSWKPLSKKLANLGPSRDASTLSGLADAEAKIADAIAAGDQNRLLVAFPAFSTILRDHFTGLDKTLLKECGHVSGVGSGLSQIGDSLCG